MSFVFTDENLKKIKEHIAKYPQHKQGSAILSVLDLAQRQCGGWLPQSAIEGVSKLLDMPFICVMEIASFYSMFNLKPVGAFHVQICGTTPCWLKGSEELKTACENHLNVKMGETTKDQMFTISEVECLGACISAPVIQIGDDYHENLSPEELIQILKNIKKSKIKEKADASS